MNIKGIFGALLGIGWLIYTAGVFVNTSGDTQDIKELIIYEALGIVFFASCISLIIQQKMNRKVNFLQKIKS